MRQQIVEQVEREIEEKGIVTDADARRIASEIVSDHHKKWQEAEAIPSVPDNYEMATREKYADAIASVRKQVFQQLPLTRRSREKLEEIAILLTTRNPKHVSPPTRSGVVIAGYGEEEFFPSLRSYNVYGMTNNLLNYAADRDLTIDSGTLAAVVPFAQSEMVQTFMEGIDPDYAKAIDRDMAVLFSLFPDVIVDHIPQLSEAEKKTLKLQLRQVSVETLGNYRMKLEKFRRSNFVDPVVSVVASLPKDELAAMAESLVNLTSFKRKVSMQAETVGGPIDVAVISKGDGFIWIRRKHYFRTELNPHFMANYFREA